MNVAQETSGLRRGGISPPLSLLMSAYSLVSTPRSVAFPLRRTYNAPLPRPTSEEVGHPELRYNAYRQSFSAQDLSMSKLLRIF